MSTPQSDNHRRDFLRALLAAPAGMTLAFDALGQTAPPIQATKLSPQLALVSGDGGNIAIAIAPDGLLMVDSGLAAPAAALLTAVNQQVDAHKVRTVFNTHWHPDHVGANEMLGKAGARIMAHENVKKRLSRKTPLEPSNEVIEPLKPEGLPVETFTIPGTLPFGAEKIEYTPFPPSHTDGDACLFFPGPNVLHTGDLFFNGRYPYIDYSTGGWIGGMAAAAGALLQVGDAQTRIIPGHGAMASKADLRTCRDMLATIDDRLSAMVKQGKTVDEAVAAAPTRDFDAWAGGAGSAGRFVRMAYTSILRHNS